MTHCLQLAEAARQAGHAPITTLVVCEAQTIEGSETLLQRLDMNRHAKIIAIRRAWRG